MYINIYIHTYIHMYMYICLYVYLQLYKLPDEPWLAGLIHSMYVYMLLKSIYLQLYKLPDEPLLAGLRPMQKSDVAACALLLNQHLAKFSLAPCMTEDEVEHWFLSREGVIYTYVC